MISVILRVRAFVGVAAVITGVRRSSALAARVRGRFTSRPALGICATSLCAVAVAVAPTAAEAQSVSDLLNSLFGAPQSEGRRAPQRPKPRFESRLEQRAEPRAERRAEPAATPIGLPVTAGEPQLAVVTLGSQNLRFYSGGKLIESAPISSGTKDFRTPTGVFTVIERHRDHESNIYESAPMPFMHRLTWSGIALHQGLLPGHPASHGCIRLPKAFVERLWEVSKVGMRVVVSPSPVEVEPVASPLLFAPKFIPVPDDIVAYLTPERAAAMDGGTALAEVRTAAGSSAVQSDAQSAMLPASTPKLKLSSQQIAALKTAASGATSLNPMQAGVVERIRAQALAPITQKAADEALAAAAAASGKANDALAELRSAEAAFKAAKAKVGNIMPDSVMTPSAMTVSSAGGVMAATASAADAALPFQEPASQEGKARLEAQRLVLKAKSRLDAATADEAVKSPAAFAAAANARQAAAVAEDALAASKVTTKRASPISVLISAKDQRLYVRQGLNPVFDVPVIVRPGAAPIGTHTFQAVSASSEMLNWVTVSVATETLTDELRYSPFNKGNRANPGGKSPGARAADDASPPAAEPSIGAAAALRALERFDLGPELTEKLSELVWVGAWIIVSEHPLSKETGPIGTDHVVLTK
jgi:lipoprotein-anchoring transpeptidase ErfK/SrfK